MDESLESRESRAIVDVENVEGSIPRFEDAHFSGATKRRPVTIVRGKGARLWDDRGKPYIDCGAAQGWANVGHSHPKVTQAIQEQAGMLVAHTESSYNDQRAFWFRDITALLGETLGETEKGRLTHVHPCSSGAEAIEGALKVARFLTKRSRIVALSRGFHGRTFGALSATSQAKYRKPFEPLVPGFDHVRADDLEAIDEAINDETAALLVEVIQGEGGVHPLDEEVLRTARGLCRDRGALFVVDEIQTGLGRTGAFFASERADLRPDVVALGKSLGGGLPMGAVVWRDGYGKLSAGSHGSTFGGNPLCCAASRAVLSVLKEERLVERAAKLGDWAFSELRSAELPKAREIRGRGLMIGIELRHRVTPVLVELLERGVWALPAGKTVLRLLPPLVIEEEDWRTAVDEVIDLLG